MDFFQILADIEKVDAEVYARFDTRRRAFRHLSGLGRRLTVATLPAVLSTMFQKAYGQSTTLPQVVVDTLNLALSLEYLEFYFYAQGVSSNLFSGGDQTAITIIRDDEQGHISTLRGVLGAAAIPDPTAAAFDYSAGGRLAPFSSAVQFLGTAQGFVDTGVRAYKGGAPNLISNKDILTAALNIHSVEARHSSHIRSMRRGYTVAPNTNGTTIAGQEAGGAGNALPKSWISLRDNGGPAPAVTAPVYGPGTDAARFPAEDNLTQAGVDVQSGSTAPSGLTLTAAAASEAFDEPLDAARVKEIARNFRSPVGVALGLFS